MSCHELETSNDVKYLLSGMISEGFIGNVKLKPNLMMVYEYLHLATVKI